jgi:DNA-binding transcriptional LysR family regulator
VDRTSSTPVNVDLDLRKLRYFVAVAEELHFGRAAQRLYVTPAVLSRQIRKLEQEIGAPLFVRSSRRVELTDAGQQLLEEARPLLAAANAAGRRVRRAAEGVRALTVGFFIGDPIGRLVGTFESEHPSVTIDVARIYWSDQTAVLFDAQVDIAFVHLPIDDDGLVLLRLYSTPRVALLPASHPLASRDSVSIAELADDPVILHRGASPTWEAWHNTDPRPDGRRPRPGPFVNNLEEKLEVVSTGRAISFVPDTAAKAVSIPPTVVAVHVTDITPTEVCLAWKAAHQSDTIRAFASSARTVFPNSARPLSPAHATVGSAEPPEITVAN